MRNKISKFTIYIIKYDTKYNINCINNHTIIFYVK